jgi:hypothetical protein
MNGVTAIAVAVVCFPLLSGLEVVSADTGTVMSLGDVHVQNVYTLQCMIEYFQTSNYKHSSFKPSNKTYLSTCVESTRMSYFVSHDVDHLHVASRVHTLTRSIITPNHNLITIADIGHRSERGETTSRSRDEKERHGVLFWYVWRCGCETDLTPSKCYYVRAWMDGWMAGWNLRRKWRYMLRMVSYGSCVEY